MSPKSSSSSSSTEYKTKDDTLQQLHSIYVGGENVNSLGLINIGKKLGLHLFAPRRKLNILLIGNHSSGKSSFINWYVDEKIQKTGVAIETQGFTLVTSGKRRETLTGEATLHLFPHLKPLQSIRGVIPYLNTELTKSNSKQTNLVTFIDTPGLADGELHYPYDIERAITWLGDKSDLIFVFFDPIGQALCKRTLNLVERLTNLYTARMRFFLSKADEAGDETDRQKVMVQITQEVCKRPGLNQSGFEMMAIYLPNLPNLKKHERMCVNQIDDVCRTIEKTIALTIQNTFNTMEKDLKQLEELAENKLRKCKSNMFANIFNIIFLIFAISCSLLLPISVFIYQSNNQSDLPSFYNFIAEILLKFIPEKGLLIYSILLAISMIIISIFFIGFIPNSSLSEMNQIKEIRKQLIEYRKKREQLFSSYLNQMIDN